MSLNHFLDVNDQIAPYMNIGCNSLKAGSIEVNNFSVNNLSANSIISGSLGVTGSANIAQLTVSGNVNTFGTGQFTGGLINTGNINCTAIGCLGSCNVNGNFTLNNNNPFKIVIPMSNPTANAPANYTECAGSFFYAGSNNMPVISEIIVTFNNFLDSICFIEVVNQTGVAPPYTPTGSTTIASSSTGLISDRFRSLSLGPLANVPTSAATITVNITRTSGTQFAKLYSITVIYG